MAIWASKRWGVGMSDVTRILNAIERGDAGATDELLPLVYEELRVLAAQKLSHESPGQTLQATALVHEAYLRLVGDQPPSWDSRGHFFAAAAEAMRRILVDRARRKRSPRHGGGFQRVELCAPCAAHEDCQEDLLALDEALDRLADQDPNLAEVVKLRYFAGLTLAQIAEIRGVCRRTVDRHWALGRAWLYREMSDGESPK
jgi:RNA polymerase sigma factor (TIGR02999 family)